jgi:hypothetical protein
MMRIDTTVASKVEESMRIAFTALGEEMLKTSVFSKTLSIVMTTTVSAAMLVAKASVEEEMKVFSKQAKEAIELFEQKAVEWCHSRGDMQMEEVKLGLKGFRAELAATRKELCDTKKAVVRLEGLVPALRRLMGLMKETLQGMVVVKSLMKEELLRL